METTEKATTGKAKDKEVNNETPLTGEALRAKRIEEFKAILVELDGLELDQSTHYPEQYYKAFEPALKLGNQLKQIVGQVVEVRGFGQEVNGVFGNYRISVIIPSLRNVRESALNEGFESRVSDVNALAYTNQKYHYFKNVPSEVGAIVTLPANKLFIEEYKGVHVERNDNGEVVRTNKYTSKTLIDRSMVANENRLKDGYSFIKLFNITGNDERKKAVIQGQNILVVTQINGEQIKPAI